MFNRIPVLVFDDVAVGLNLRGARGVCFNSDQLQAYLDWIDRWGFTPITFEDFRFFLGGELNLPRRPIILTFDWGSRKIFDIAFPILKEYGMRAVVFVIGDREMKTIRMDLIGGPLEYELLGPHQIMEMHSFGFEIGSLTMTHADLTGLSPEQCRYEITRSRMTLEILLNAPVQAFAYPYGKLTPALKSMVEEAGYAVAVARDSGPKEFGRDLMEVRRIQIGGGTTSFGLAVRTFSSLVGLSPGLLGRK
jgi:peptidoglycan/xylan/chitin deacetylase (PgdA/CDA1 family)